MSVASRAIAHTTKGRRASGHWSTITSDGRAVDLLSDEREIRLRGEDESMFVSALYRNVGNGARFGGGKQVPGTHLYVVRSANTHSAQSLRCI